MSVLPLIPAVLCPPLSTAGHFYLAFIPLTQTRVRTTVNMISSQQSVDTETGTEGWTEGGKKQMTESKAMPSNMADINMSTMMHPFWP